jgi:DNA-binding response OmpR family regulator
MRVLLVEDDPIIGDGACMGLKQHGCAVDWVTTNADARLALKAETFDAIVPDLGLRRQKRNSKKM